MTDPIILAEAEVPQECQVKKSPSNSMMKILFFISTGVSMFEISYCIFYGSAAAEFFLTSDESHKPSLYSQGVFMFQFMTCFALMFSLLTFIVGMLLGKKSFVKQVLIAHGLCIFLLIFKMFDPVKIVQQIVSFTVKYFYYKKLMQKINNQESFTSLSGLNIFVDVHLNAKITWLINFLSKLLLVGEVYVCFYLLSFLIDDLNEGKVPRYTIFYIPVIALLLSAFGEIAASNLRSVRFHLCTLGFCYFSAPLVALKLMVDKKELRDDFDLYWCLTGIGSLYLIFHFIHYLIQRAQHIENFEADQLLRRSPNFHNNLKNIPATIEFESTKMNPEVEGKFINSEASAPFL